MLFRSVALSEKLPPPMQRALAEVTMDGEARPVSFLEISAYLNALERKRLTKQRAQLMTTIRDSQKSPDPPPLRELLEAVQQLDRKLAELG